MAELVSRVRFAGAQAGSSDRSVHSPVPHFSSPGEYSYLGTTLRQVLVEPMPSLLDVRQLVALYGILPLGKDPAPCVPFPEAGCTVRRL